MMWDFPPDSSARSSSTLPANCPRARGAFAWSRTLRFTGTRCSSTTTPDAQARSTEIPLASATLHFRGYPKQIEGASPGDLDYDYDRVSLTGPFQRQRGNYTRIGDVTPLLKSIDDRFVIFGSGEEIAAEFDTRAASCAACALEARLLLLRQRLRQGHGLVGCVALHRCATAVSWDEQISLSGERKIPRRSGCARIPVELERPLRLGRIRCGRIVSITVRCTSTPADDLPVSAAEAAQQ